MFEGRNLALVAILSAAAITNVLAQISIESIAFHKTTYNAAQAETGDVDTGGTVFVFVRNNGATPEAITNITFNGVAITNVPDLRWWRVFPEVLMPGGIVTMTAHMITAPLAEGATLSVTIETVSGNTASNSTVLTTPQLRLGSLVPSQDFHTLYLNLRNLDTVPYAVKRVLLNDDVTAQCTFVGSNRVAPSNVGIVKIVFTNAQPLMTNYVIRVIADRLGATTNEIEVGAPVRLLEPKFHLGTWSSSGVDAEPQIEWARRRPQLDVNTGVNGGGFTSNSNKLWNAWAKWRLRAIDQINFGSPSVPDAAVAARYKDNPMVMAWYLRDEPDLNGRPSSELAAHDLILRRADPNHPVILNLAANRAFAEFGKISDIPSMDHYAMYAPYVNTFQVHTMDEPLIYSDVLKENTEPLRMWSWAQGVAEGTWGTQPPDWGISIQFWSHVMAGAKGIKWFKSVNKESSYPTQMNMIENVTKQLCQVRNLLLYGETMSNVVTGPLRVASRSITSEDAMVVIVANMNADEPVPTFGEWFLTDLPSANVQFQVPLWIPIEQVTEITPGGPVAPATVTTNGRTLRLDFPLHDARVFLIGRRDTVPPEAPTGWNVASWRYPSSAVTAVFAWDVPFDNYGVQGYRVYRDGIEAGTVTSPVFIDTNVPNQGAYYTIRAFDGAGNLGAASAPIPVVDPKGRPKLNISSLANAVEINWAPFFTNFQLQASANLSVSNWSSISSVSNRTMISPSNAANYYRLIRP